MKTFGNNEFPLIRSKQINVKICSSDDYPFIRRQQIIVKTFGQNKFRVTKSE